MSACRRCAWRGRSRPIDRAPINLLRDEQQRTAHDALKRVAVTAGVAPVGPEAAWSIARRMDPVEVPAAALDDSGWRAAVPEAVPSREIAGTGS